MVFTVCFLKLGVLSLHIHAAPSQLPYEQAQQKAIGCTCFPGGKMGGCIGALLANPATSVNNLPSHRCVWLGSTQS